MPANAARYVAIKGYPNKWGVYDYVEGGWKEPPDLTKEKARSLAVLFNRADAAPTEREDP